jgi:hypothetical protein
MSEDVAYKRTPRDDLSRYSPEVQRIMRKYRLLEQLDPEAAREVRTLVEDTYESLRRRHSPRRARRGKAAR